MKQQRWWFLCAMTFSLLALSVRAADETPQRPQIRFATVDIFIDPEDRALAAYQVEFKASSGSVKIVGIEGGEHAAFREAPYYDPKAIQQERVVLAAFSTGTQLPTSRTRVATIHVQISGTVAPEYGVKLIAAARGDAISFQPTVTAKERTPQ